MSILDVTDTPFKDNSIEEYEYFEYLPIVGAVNNLNNAGGVITINIETQDIFMHPSESYLLIEGRLTKTGGGDYGNDDNVALTNNGLMYLFSTIKYDLSGKEIELINHPGWATTMLGLLKYDDSFSKSRGLNQLWYKDTSTAAEKASDQAGFNLGFKMRSDHITVKPATKGKFSFCVPLKHIFGFCEDYDKIVYGMKHTLSLLRVSNDDAIFRSVADAAKVTLSKIAWYMPHVLPADKYKMELYKHIEHKETFEINYRMILCDTAEVPNATSFSWRFSVNTLPDFPRYIIIGFQTEKKNDQTKNPAIFDHVNVRNIHVTLNSYKYPNADYALSFEDQIFSRAYVDAAKFRSKFFFMDDLASNPNFTPLEYRDLYPLFLINVSKQSERIKYNVRDIHMKVQFGAAPAAGTHVYGVVICDRLIKFQSDGNKMNVVY